MWSKNPTPVRATHLPVPSRLRANRIFVSLVSRVISALRSGMVRMIRAARRAAKQLRTERSSACPHFQRVTMSEDERLASVGKAVGEGRFGFGELGAVARLRVVPERGTGRDEDETGHVRPRMMHQLHGPPVKRHQRQPAAECTAYADDLPVKRPDAVRFESHLFG